MVRFASDCLIKMRELTQELELELGPGENVAVTDCNIVDCMHLFNIHTPLLLL